MPKIYRSMKEDADGRPVIEQTNKGLGVRAAPGSKLLDVDLDQDGKVFLNGKGMSVAPTWRELPPHLVSRRLKERFPDAIGSQLLRCFTMGNGPFQNGPVADRLDLICDKPKHGVVAPRLLDSLDQFQADLASTRDDWMIDED
jgi:hypothetical protein